MKLTKKEIKEISDLYGLGEIEEVELIDDGMVNSNFVSNFERGKFVIRFLRNNLDDKYLSFRKTEFEVLNYLRDKGYPYNIPVPIMNYSGGYISRISKGHFWIYAFIDGEKPDRGTIINTKKVREIAKALAIYHNLIKGFKFNSNKKKLRSLDWLFSEYDFMKKIKPKGKLDRLMLENIDFFYSLLESIAKTDFKGDMLLTHSDFHQNNLLFKKDKVVGVLDFDNIGFSLKSKDIAISAKSVCDVKDRLDERKLKIFLKEYVKYNKLTKVEINQIKPLILRNYCQVFWWAYKGKMKNNKVRLPALKHTIEKTRRLVDER